MERFNDPLIKSAQLQAANVLLDSTIEYLIQNGLSKDRIYSRLKGANRPRRRMSENRQFNALARAYEEMGSVLSTWYDSPGFLNSDGSPAPLTLFNGRRSLRKLLKEAGVATSEQTAISLFRRSPSVKFDKKNQILALRRVFVLPNFDLPRAAIVVPRYLDTLSSNSNAHRSGTIKLLERQCSASKIDLKAISPILRRIKEEGTSFVDSIDAQLEDSSVKRKTRKKTANSDLGLVVFAWTNGSIRKTRNPK